VVAKYCYSYIFNTQPSLTSSSDIQIRNEDSYPIWGGNELGMGIRSGIDLGMARRPGEGPCGTGLRKRRRLIIVQGINKHIFIIKHG